MPRGALLVPLAQAKASRTPCVMPNRMLKVGVAPFQASRKPAPHADMFSSRRDHYCAQGDELERGRETPRRHRQTDRNTSRIIRGRHIRLGRIVPWWIWVAGRDERQRLGALIEGRAIATLLPNTSGGSSASDIGSGVISRLPSITRRSSPSRGRSMMPRCGARRTPPGGHSDNRSCDGSRQQRGICRGKSLHGESRQYNLYRSSLIPKSACTFVRQRVRKMALSEAQATHHYSLDAGDVPPVLEHNPAGRSLLPFWDIRIIMAGRSHVASADLWPAGSLELTLPSPGMPSAWVRRRGGAVQTARRVHLIAVRRVIRSGW